jgi:hypothetical protein
MQLHLATSLHCEFPSNRAAIFILGIVGDVRDQSLEDKRRTAVYQSAEQVPFGSGIMTLHCTSGAFNRPISAYLSGVSRVRASQTILVSRLARRPRRRREAPSGSVRRNISRTCCAAWSASTSPGRSVRADLIASVGVSVPRLGTGLLIFALQVRQSDSEIAHGHVR